ncbi:MAG: ferredoxin [Lachnospiraceae bacterium]|nr:ferredoxin [Anaerocolumna sp.]MDF2611109.1 ferredoxin [Lachnospiraceae bacterium]
MDRHDNSKSVTGHYANEDLVITIQDCEANCEHMIQHLLLHEKMEPRKVQAILLLECIDICMLTAKYTARDAIYARHAAALCADICDACGNECANFPDQLSQHCAIICINCARHCRYFAAIEMDH